MENKDNPEPTNVHRIKRPRLRLSRTRLVMLLLLIVAIAIFISLANRAVHENSEAIQQSFSR